MRRIQAVSLLLILAAISFFSSCGKEKSAQWYQQGLKYEEEDKVFEAAAQFQKILEKFPESNVAIDAYNHLEHRIIVDNSGSGGYFIEDEEIKLLYRYREALEKHGKKVGDSAETHKIFSWSYIKFGKYEKAIQEAKKAIELDPNNHDLHKILSMISQKKEEAELEQKLIEAATEYNADLYRQEEARRNEKMAKEKEKAEAELEQNLIEAAKEYIAARAVYDQMKYELNYRTLSHDLQRKATELERYTKDTLLPKFQRYGILAERYGNKYGAMALRDLAIQHGFFHLYK